MPCMIVGSAMRQEFGTWKWVVVAFTYQTVLDWTVVLLIYQGGGHSWDWEDKYHSAHLWHRLGFSECPS